MTDLNSFRDNIIAIEAIRKSDLLSRTTAPRREPLQPRLGPGSLNDVVPTEVPIKPESPYPTPRDENRPPLSYSAPASRPLIGIDSVGCEPLSQPSRSCHTAPQFNVEDFMKECALRDFVHERLEGLIPGLDVLDADVGKPICSTIRNLRQHTLTCGKKTGGLDLWLSGMGCQLIHKTCTRQEHLTLSKPLS